MTQLSTLHETPMLLSAPPLEHTPPCPGAPPKVLSTTYTGMPCHCSRARTAAPPRSGPAESQRLPVKRECTILSRPPRSKMAPPPPPLVTSAVRPVALPSVKVRFCTVSCGYCWFWQCEVVQPCAWSQVFRYRIRRAPPPLSVTLPPPSRTTRAEALRSFAVAAIVITTGSGPQEKVITPPAATAATTAAEVQLAGVPLPTTWSGCEVSSG